MIYAAIILLIAAVVICHFHDWKDNKNGHTNHSRNLKYKILSAIPAGTLFLINLTGWHVLFGWSTFLASGKASLLTATWFLFLFNELWGIRAYHKLFARSTAVDKNISRWDQFVLHWPKLLYVSFVLGLVTGATILYFIKWPTF